MAIPPPHPPPSSAPSLLTTPQGQVTAAAAAAPPRPATILSSSIVTPDRLAAALEANNKCIAAVANHLMLFFKGSMHLSPSALFQAFFALARSIDYALSGNDIPAIAHRLPSLIKQVFRYRNDPFLQSAVMVVMLSSKNACKNKWFRTSDTNELLNMANELCSSFCMSLKDATHLDNAINTISKITPRYYPQIKFRSLIVSFEAKPGYDILMVDFQIPRNIPPDQRIVLFVVQTDNLETSSCIITPPEVSFLVNGRAVDRRTNCSMDAGPQFPTDISKLLKYGTNIIQAIGYFSGNCLITIAFISKMASSYLGRLESYVGPLVAADALDADIIEGPSRITLNCPISFKRITTPVKGHLCKHHQCFDYENFLEMNMLKPSWRCPCCNSPVSCIDLRIDQNMAQLLKEAGPEVSNAVVSPDGSWKNVVKNNGTINQFHKETDEHQNSDTESSISKLAGVMDLTMEENSDAPETEDRLPLHGSASGRDSYSIETAERKQFIWKTCLPTILAEPATFSVIENTQTTLRPSSSPSYSSFESVSITPGINAQRHETCDTPLSAVLNSIQTDAVTPAHTPDFMSQPSSAFQSIIQGRQIAENIQLQSHNADLVVSNETNRNPIPRHVTRYPIAVQALPAQTQSPMTYQSLRTDLLNSSMSIDRGASAAYQTLPSSATSPSGIELVQRAIAQQSIPTGLTSTSLQQQSVSQSVTGLPAASYISTVAPQEQLRGLGAFRVAALQSTTSKLEFSRVPSNQMQQASQNAMPLSSVGNNRNNHIASQRSAQAAMMRAGAAKYLSESRIVSTPAAPDSDGSQPSATSNGQPQPPLEQNWQPTGRMRGSLTGNAYSAAISQYLNPRPPQPRGPTS